MDSQSLNTIPHLTTVLQEPLEDLQTHLFKHRTKIEQWLRLQWQDTPAPFYASVDLRNAGFKLAPVDTNLFPAGFNNLDPKTIPLAVQAVQSVIERLNVGAYGILLIPENHTRNLHYLESLATLYDILQKAGYEVRIGPQTLTLPSKRRLRLEPLIREGDCISVKNFVPCLVLLNNDLSCY